MTGDIIDSLPLPVRVVVDVAAVLTVTGVLPALLIAGLMALCDAVGWWLVWPLLGAELGYILWLV